MQDRKYPKIFIRSKNDFAKHISHRGFPKEEALKLINDVTQNFDKYWRDNKRESKPDKQKYVRSAKGTPLGLLLDKINKMILAPHDEMLPNFIFGGVYEMNHVKAAKYLLGNKRKRVAIKMDITRFFEQIERERVFHFFYSKCHCNEKISNILADICCIPAGEKGSGFSRKTIARGFATSSRLAIWCNLNTFIRLSYLVKRKLKGKDPRLMIYVDDIGITASRVPKEKMGVLSQKIENMLFNFDKNQRLPVNPDKTKITSHEEGMEQLGLRLLRNKLALGAKTKSKRDRARAKLKKITSIQDKISVRNRIKSLNQYKNYIEKI